MARISKNSRVLVDSVETRYAIFPKDAVVLNHNECNVWGYNDDGEFWFQIEKGTEIDTPYLNSWFYKLFLKQSEEEGKHTNRYLYEYSYRCYKEAYNKDVQTRTVWCKGNKTVFKAREDAFFRFTECMRVTIPIVQFYNKTKVSPGNRQRTHIFFTINAECMPFSDMDESSYLTGNYAHIILPREAERLELLPIVENNIKNVHALISEHCKFTDEFGVEHGVTPENISQIKDAEELVSTKVKIAKVVHDWISRNTDYSHKVKNSTLPDGPWSDRVKPDSYNSYGWWLRSMYGCLAKNLGVCAAFTKTANFFLNQYGVETVSIRTDDTTHVWNLVNYHDQIGEYTNDSTKWCEIDLTPHISKPEHSTLDYTPETIPDLSDNVVSWYCFNRSRVNPTYDLSDYPTIVELPVMTTADEEHRYKGNKVYDW